MIVLDNLDRIDAQDTLSILSTLQTFIDHKVERDQDWLSRVWVIIPYDKKSLQKLWPPSSPDDDFIALSFLDKRFQIRFEVPPLVLSDWSTYLLKLLKEAFPDHEESEFHQTYRVYALYRTDPDKTPTPRDLKLYVNQIGAFHRQWQNNIRLPHIGYYVLIKRIGGDIEKDLQGGKFRDQKLESLLDQNISDNLAVLYYNVDPSLAQQVLLKNPITKSLEKGDTEKLIDLSKISGFEQVIEGISFTDWIDGESYRIANAAFALDKTKVLQNINSFAASTIRRSLKEATLSITNWGIFDLDISKGIIALLSILNFDHNVLMKSIDAIISKRIPDDNETPVSESFKSWIIGLVYFIEEIDVMKVFNISELPGYFKLLTNENGYIEACILVYEKDNDGKYWSWISPIINTELIAVEFGELAKRNDFTQRYLYAIRVMQAGSDKIDWNPLVTEIANQLTATAFSSPQILSVQLSVLWELLPNDDNVENLMKSMVEHGNILDRLSKTQSDNEFAAWCLISHAYFSPDFSVISQVGDSSTGAFFY